MLKILLLMAMVTTSHATLFQIQSVEEQIKEADGVMVGHYLRSESIVLDDGSIATQMIFKMNKEYGLSSKTFGMDEVIVHFPGGSIGDQVVKVEGNPELVSGEKVVLLIKNHKDRYWGLNLGLGTFRVVKYANGPVLMNSLFPENTKVSQIKLSDFEHKVVQLKGSKLVSVKNSEDFIPDDSLEAVTLESEIEGKKRSIASTEEQVENNIYRAWPQSGNYWLVALLAVLGCLFRIAKRKMF